mgnify:CR=1 FL=1
MKLSSNPQSRKEVRSAPGFTKAGRCYKDLVEETEDLVKFFEEPQNKKTLDKMVQLLGKLRKVEKYHRERTYYPRVKE